MAAKYIFGSKNVSGTIRKLSISTKGLTSGLLSDPHKMENVIGLVRTAAPLTSDKTISKINTYLPTLELASTLLGMYSFLNKAQSYTPIKSLNASTPLEKVSALISSGNIPIGKILAQPLIANNMDKIVSSVAKGVIGNGNNGNINELISSMANQYCQGQGDTSSNGDLSSLMETFMPLINNIMSSHESNPETNDNAEESKEVTLENGTKNNNVKFDENIMMKENDNQNNYINNNETSNRDNRVNLNNKNYQPKNTPIRIRQRRKRPKT